MSSTTAPGEPGENEPRPGLERLRAALSDSPLRSRSGRQVEPPASEAAPGTARMRAAFAELWKENS